jgi:aspartokinase
MESINQQVWKALQTDPAIMRGLERKLVNTRALAKYIINKYDLKVSLDAVISSIRRFPLEKYQEEEKMLHHIFNNSVVGTKNNMACITVNLPPNQAFAKLCMINMPTMRMTTGTEEVKIIVENSQAEEIAKLFKKPEIERGLSEINVTVSEKAVKTKGVMARIAAELAMANINVHELLVCPPEFLIYVSQKDIVKAHERIITLTTS